MRIKQLKIEGLFGMFTHTIPLHDEHLTIIYGENGIGKTTIFKILKTLFNTKSSIFLPSFLQEQKIDAIELLFDDGSTRRVDNKNPLRESYYELFKINIAFIETQRLIYIQKEVFEHSEKPLKFEDATFSIRSVTVKYAHELSNIIKQKNEYYKQISDDLKNSQNDRIERNELKTNLSDIELQALLDEIQSRRTALREVGILENGVGKTEIPKDAFRRGLLMVNMQDVLTQLKVYDEDNFYERLQLFVTILNERRLSYKKIILSEKKGFIFKNDNDIELNANDLSSGEQHEIALLYQLLLKTPENSLILLDEPETSLHIAWQLEFIEDMQDIIRLRNFDILLATHSSAIINGNWGITVSLKGGNEHE